MNSPFKPQERGSVERAQRKYEVAAMAFEALVDVIRDLEVKADQAMERVCAHSKRLKAAFDLAAEGKAHDDIGDLFRINSELLDQAQTAMVERSAAWAERKPTWQAMNRAERALYRARDAAATEARQVIFGRRHDNRGAV